MRVKVTHASGYSSPFDGEHGLDDLFAEFGSAAVEAAMRSVYSGKPEHAGNGLLFEALWVEGEGWV